MKNKNNTKASKINLLTSVANETSKTAYKQQTLTLRQTARAGVSKLWPTSTTNLARDVGRLLTRQLVPKRKCVHNSKLQYVGMMSLLGLGPWDLVEESVWPLG